MSSRDVIIADIIRLIGEQQERSPTNHFYPYYFDSIKKFHGIHCLLQLEFGFRLGSDNPNQCKVNMKLIHPMMDDEFKNVDDLFSDVLGQYPNFDEENISLALDRLKQVLSTLTFSVYRGDFYTTPSTHTAQIDFFSDVEGLEFKGDECCVCHELVKTKTECNHYLCIPCYQQIKISEDEEERRPCPICREHLFYTSA